MSLAAAIAAWPSASPPSLAGTCAWQSTREAFRFEAARDLFERACGSGSSRRTERHGVEARALGAHRAGRASRHGDDRLGETLVEPRGHHWRRRLQDAGRRGARSTWRAARYRADRAAQVRDVRRDRRASRPPRAASLRRRSPRAWPRPGLHRPARPRREPSAAETASNSRPQDEASGALTPFLIMASRVARGRAAKSAIKRKSPKFSGELRPSPSPPSDAHRGCARARAPPARRPAWRPA